LKKFLFVLALAAVVAAAFGQSMDAPMPVAAPEAKPTPDQTQACPTGPTALAGPKGDKGDPGTNGHRGRPGKTVIIRQPFKPLYPAIAGTITSDGLIARGYFDPHEKLLWQALGYDSAWAFEHGKPKTDSKPPAGPKPASSTSPEGNSATAPGENGMYGLNWRDIFLIIGLAVFVGWLVTYLFRGPMPMWIRTNLRDLTSVKAWVKEVSAHGDSREIGPPANWEATKLSDITTEPKALIRERSAHGDFREIIPIAVAQTEAQGRGEVAHCNFLAAEAGRAARQLERDTLLAARAVAAPPTGGGGWSLVAEHPAPTAPPVNVNVYNYGGGQGGGGQQAGGGQAGGQARGGRQPAAAAAAAPAAATP